MTTDEYVYAQSVGPVPITDPDIETGSNVEYPKDSFSEYYGSKEISIPWVWIILLFVLIISATLGFLFMQKKLKKKDREDVCQSVWYRWKGRWF